MRIILDVDEEYSKEGVISYFRSINIDDEFIRSITFERGKE